MEGQMLHVITDIIQSIGVIISSALIKWQPFDVGTTESEVGRLSRWVLVDPLITILFAALILYTTVEEKILRPKGAKIFRVNREMQGKIM